MTPGSQERSFAGLIIGIMVGILGINAHADALVIVITAEDIHLSSDLLGNPLEFPGWPPSQGRSWQTTFNLPFSPTGNSSLTMDLYDVDLATDIFYLNDFFAYLPTCPEPFYTWYTRAFTIPSVALRQGENAFLIQTASNGTSYEHIRFRNVVLSVDLPGDVDKDGQVDATDLDIGVVNLDKSSGDSGWDSRADLDSDGEVTSTDLSIVLANMPLPGDVNKDGKVDEADLSIILSVMDSTPADSNWDARADLDTDDEVTSTDISMVLDNMN